MVYIVSSTSDLSTGAIVGIVIFGAAILLTVTVGSLLFYCKLIKLGKCSNPFRNSTSSNQSRIEANLNNTSHFTMTEIPMQSRIDPQAETPAHFQHPQTPLGFDSELPAQELPPSFQQSQTIVDSRPPPPPYDPSVGLEYKPLPYPVSDEAIDDPEMKESTVTAGFATREPPRYDPTWKLDKSFNN